MFRPSHGPLLSRRRFARRQFRHLVLSGALIAACLAVGAVGYHALEGLGWLDSVYAAAMILTTMGPACELHHDAAKVFVTFYALFSLLVFVTAATVVASPLLHRMLHMFHLQELDREAASRQSEKAAQEPR